MPNAYQFWICCGLEDKAMDSQGNVSGSNPCRAVVRVNLNLRKDLNNNNRFNQKLLYRGFTV